MYPGCTLLGEITDVETIAVGHGIRNPQRLNRTHGEGRWRKLKGRARIHLPDGTAAWAEVRWHEMTSVGRKELNVKRLLP